MTTQPTPTAIEVPQAMSDAAACPTPSTVLLDTQATSDAAACPTPNAALLSTQAPTEKSSLTMGVIQSSPSHADPTASISAINPAPAYDTPHSILATPPIADISLASEPIAVSGEQPTQNKGNDDVVMTDAPSLVQKPQNDENLPPWLVPMIKYLHRVTMDMAWQNLVTEFIEFEKGDPPTGVSFFFFAKVETNFLMHIHRSCPRSVNPRRSPTGYGARRKMLYHQSNLLSSANGSWSGGR